MTPNERAKWREVYCDDARIIILLDALAEVERERDEATARLRKHCLDESCCDGSDVMPDLIAERDAARRWAKRWRFGMVFWRERFALEEDHARTQVAELRHDVEVLTVDRDQWQTESAKVRAQATTLAEAMRWYANAVYDKGVRARAALKAAGVEVGK